MRLAPRPALAGIAVLLAVSLGAGCSSDETPPDAAETPASSAPPLPSGEPKEFQITTHTTIGQVVGRLGKRDRGRVASQVTDVVQRWFNNAYVGGKFPRSGFGDAFRGFTSGARQKARRDKHLMTNIGIGDQVSTVTPTRSRLHLDVLAARKRAAGVTARFLLRFRTEGDLERKVAVRGRLFLTRAGSGWRIFGYDVSKGGRKA